MVLINLARANVSNTNVLQAGVQLIIMDMLLFFLYVSLYQNLDKIRGQSDCKICFPS